MMRKLTLHKAILIALLAFLIVYPASPALAGINIWTSQGPEGGSINTLAMHPQSPDNIYAGTEGNGVFKSTDRGQCWDAFNAGLINSYVNSLAIDPQNPGNLYA